MKAVGGDGKSRPIKIATRGSALALWQAEYVKQLHTAAGLASEICVIKTKGDQDTSTPLHLLGSKSGAFIKEIEDRLEDGAVDVAVHSLKDVALTQPPGLALVCVLKRGPHQDCVIFNETYRDLPELRTGVLDRKFFADRQPRLATGSLRRQAFLRSIHKGYPLIPLRGNVNTRLQRMVEKGWDGIMLAKAGVERINLAPHLRVVDVDDTLVVPAPGQGALGLEARADHPLQKVWQGWQDPPTRYFTDLERKIMKMFGGTCTLPMGVHCLPTTIKGKPGVGVKVFAGTLDGDVVYVDQGIADTNGDPQADPRILQAVKELALKLGINRILKALGIKEVEI